MEGVEAKVLVGVHYCLASEGPLRRSPHLDRLRVQNGKGSRES